MNICQIADFNFTFVICRLPPVTKFGGTSVALSVPVYCMGQILYHSKIYHNDKVPRNKDNLVDMAQTQEENKKASING